MAEGVGIVKTLAVAALVVTCLGLSAATLIKPGRILLGRWIDLAAITVASMIIIAGCHLPYVGSMVIRSSEYPWKTGCEPK